MDGDPYYWTVPQVADFFRQDATRLASSRPNSVLPDLEAFASAIEANDVSGEILLTDIDVGVLRDDFNITSFGMRTSITRCIRSLRKDSAVYQATNSSSLKPPVPFDVRPGLESQLASHQDILPLGSNIRPGEVQVQDLQGRKRRKLDPTSLASTKSTSDQPKLVAIAPPEYLPIARLLVDDLFFGITKMGDEINDFQPLDKTLFLGQDQDSSAQNFQFLAGGTKTAGEVAFVGSRLRAFLRSDPVEIHRGGRYAEAIVPYRQVHSTKAQSALIFKFTAGGLEEDAGAILTREDVAFLTDDVDYTRRPEEVLAGGGDSRNVLSGEWDFLVEKYRQGSRDPSDVPVLHDLNDDESLSSSLMHEVEEEEAEVARSKARILSEDDIVQTIQEAIDRYKSEWKEKLLQKDQREAWTVWEKMKRSRTMRDVLIASAEARIANFKKRLARFKDEFLGNEWRSRASLEESCESIRPTVEDIETDEWKITVWRRGQEPQHARKQGQHSTHRKKPMASSTSSGIIVPEHDRLSEPPELLSNPQEPSDEMEQFHTPQFGPEIGNGDDPLTNVSLEAPLDDGFIANTPRSASLLETFEAPERSPGPSSDFEENRDFSDMRHKHGSDDDDLDYEDPDPESDEDLPSPSTFVASGTKKQHAPSTPVSHTSNSKDVTIDLTLSSDSSTPSKQIPKKHSAVKGSRYTSDPENATAAEVKSWNLAELESQNDRRRLLIKLLHMAGRDEMGMLNKVVKEMKIRGLQKAIPAALRSLQAGTHPDFTTNSEHQHAATKCAHLFLRWLWLYNDDVKEVDWQSVFANEPQQVPLFIHALLGILKKKDTKLFMSPASAAEKSHDNRNPSIPSRRSAAQAIEISSDDDQPTPHKKRKKEIKVNEQVEQSQKEAIKRLKRFQSAVESQPSNSQLFEDPTTSGVKINPMQNDNNNAIYIHKGIAAKMKPHQVHGARFMWRELTDVEGQGCILAHVMGLGKTMQAIALLVALDQTARSDNSRIRHQLPEHLRPSNMGERQLRMLILSPPNLLQNWQRELRQWAPKALGRVYLVESPPKISILTQLREWFSMGGVFLIGYEMFRSRIFFKNVFKPYETGTLAAQREQTEIEELLLQGPEIVIADEAQKLKNPTSGISQAVKKIRTESKIGLTGTPMSNDVQEIYSLVSFVAPGYLGPPDYFRAQFAEPILEGTFADSTKYEIRRSMIKLQVLRDKIDPKVDRQDITVLRGSLKPKVEFVITLPITSSQNLSYCKYVQSLLGDAKNKEAGLMRVFSWLAVLTLLMNHPLAFKRKLLGPRKICNKVHDDEDEGGVNVDLDEAIGVLGFTDQVLQKLTADIKDDLSAALSPKMEILVEILRLSKDCGDRVLVFSSSIPTLDYIGELLHFHNIKFGRIDGEVPIPKRPPIIDDINAGRTDVLLLSTRAAGVGLNIQTANRVVIIDFGFNPAHEEQAIGRAYRLGQTKPVFVYRLKCGGTFEMNIYNRQMFKTSLTQRVVDKKNPRRTAEKDIGDWIYEPRPVIQEDIQQWVGKDPAVMDLIIQDQTRRIANGEVEGLIRALDTMETLQAEVTDAPLTVEEQLMVAEEITMSRAIGRRKKPKNPLLDPSMPYPGALFSTGPVAPPSTASPTAQTHIMNLPMSRSRAVGTSAQARADTSSAVAASSDDRPPLAGLPFIPPPRKL